MALPNCPSWNLIRAKSFLKESQGTSMQPLSDCVAYSWPVTQRCPFLIAHLGNVIRAKSSLVEFQSASMQPLSDCVAYSWPVPPTNHVYIDIGAKQKNWIDWSNNKEMEALAEISVRRRSINDIDPDKSLVTCSHGNTSKLGLLMVASTENH